MEQQPYSSPAMHLTSHTCVDVHADARFVVLGHVGDRTTGATHLTPDQARTLACALIEGAEKSDEMAVAK